MYVAYSYLIKIQKIPIMIRYDTKICDNDTKGVSAANPKVKLEYSVAILQEWDLISKVSNMNGKYLYW